MQKGSQSFNVSKFPHRVSVKSEKELIFLGEKCGHEILKKLQKNSTALPQSLAIELLGDVGAGKTTFARGLAQGLGITEPITSPSFTICKKYAFALPSAKKSAQTSAPGNKTVSTSAQKISRKTVADDEDASIPADKSLRNPAGTLSHYDFYRLPDPGIMRGELSETLLEPNSVVIIEWGESVSNLLPAKHLKIQIVISPEGGRDVAFSI